MKRALITGVTGQDGSYLAEFLLDKGYQVHGMVRRSSTENFERIGHLREKISLHQADLLDSSSLVNLLREVRPAEIYNLAAQSFVPTSWVQPTLTGEFTALGVTRMLDAVKIVDPEMRFYQASSSEMFGNAPAPQVESTPFRPQSPYACAKVYGYWMTVNYRDGYGMFAANGILFNHESPRRGETFVSRKITRAVAGILAGAQQKLYLGTLTSKRDWGYAPEYVEVMWKMLQHDSPGDYVVGTGESHSVQEFLEKAFAYAGLDWRQHVETDQRYVRPTDVALLMADASKARRELGWEPKVRFDGLVKIMVDADMEAAGLTPPGEGRKLLADSGWGDAGAPAFSSAGLAPQPHAEA